MKAILISIQSPHACNILNLIKLWEIRKKFPKDYVGWVYIYVTKTLPLLLKNKDSGKMFINKLKAVEKDNLDRLPHIQKFNGKVVARFWCDKVEEIDDCFTMEHIGNEYPDTYELGAMEEEQLLKECCLTKEEMNAYYKGVKEPLKAIHIDKVEIFDKPKEIGEFKYYKKFSGTDYMLPIPRKETCERLVSLTRAPQSWCYVEV